MTTVGQLVRPLFPNLTLPDSTRIGLQRAIPVGPTGSAVRAALAQLRPGEVFADTDWLTVNWDDNQAFSDTVAVIGLLNDPFDGTSVSAAWTVSGGAPVVSGGKLHLSNRFPQDSIRSSFTHSFLGTAFSLLGFVPTIGPIGNEGYRGRGLIVQDASNPGVNFVQFIRIGTNWLMRVNPGTTGSTPYDPAHSNIRLREAGGQLNFEVSANGTTWTPLRQTADPSWMATAQASVFIYSGAWNSSGSDPSTEATVDRATWV